MTKFLLALFLLTTLVCGGCKKTVLPEPGAARAHSAGALEAGTAPSGASDAAAPAAPAPVVVVKHAPPASVVPGTPAAQGTGRAVLQLPERVWAGDPFPVSVVGPGLTELRLRWKGKSLTLAPRHDGEACLALLAVPLKEKAASLPLAVTARFADGTEEAFTRNLAVAKKDYPVQRLKVQQKYVTPPPEVQEKIKRDRAELRAAISQITPVRYWSLPMQRPVPGVVTSLYGLRRVFNGEERNPHTGVDFDAKQGDPIAALDKGVVVLVADHYYSGNIVVVDHGLGVFSMYLHLSAFKVSVGQTVERGQTVGLVGSTGRVTGPHLHMSFNVLGESVNGAAAIDM